MFIELIQQCPLWVITSRRVYHHASDWSRPEADLLRIRKPRRKEVSTRFPSFAGNTSAIRCDAGILDSIISGRRNNNAIKQAAWQDSVTGIGWESYAIAIELDCHASESARAVSDTFAWDRSIRSEVDGLCDLPGATWVCRGFKRDIKVDDSTDRIEVDEYDIVFDSVD